MKTLNTFVTGLLITNRVYILVKIRQGKEYPPIKYKTAFGSNISLMSAGRDDVKRANGIKSSFKGKIDF